MILAVRLSFPVLFWSFTLMCRFLFLPTVWCHLCLICDQVCVCVCVCVFVLCSTWACLLLCLLVFCSWCFHWFVQFLVFGFFVSLGFQPPDIKSHSWFFCPVSAFGSSCSTTSSYMSTARKMEIQTKHFQFWDNWVNSILILTKRIKLQNSHRLKTNFYCSRAKKQANIVISHLQRKQEELETAMDFVSTLLSQLSSLSCDERHLEEPWRSAAGVRLVRNLFYIDIHIIRGDKFSPCSGVRYSRTGHMTPTSSPQIKKQKKHYNVFWKLSLWESAAEETHVSQWTAGEKRHICLKYENMRTDPVPNTEPDQCQSHLLLNFNIWGF